MTRTRLQMLAMIATMLLLAGACGVGAETAADTASDAAESVTDAGFDDSGDAGELATDAMADSDTSAEATDVPAEARSDALGSGGATPTGLTAAQQGRQIIFVADVAVEVDDVVAAGDEASRVIADVGGFVSGLETVTDPMPQSIITFKVLPENFADALEQVSDIGELQNQRVTTDDVTERVVDLESRIEVAQLGVERLRTAMENAPDLDEFASLEALLLERESTLEVMRGQLRTLRDQIDLATITLRLQQARIDNAIEIVVTAYPGHDGGVSCPGGRDQSVERGTEVTLCLEVANVGDQAVQNVSITDTVLGITSSTDLIAVFGSLEDIPAGQTADVAFEFVPERDLQLRTRASATPIGEDRSTSPAVSAESNARLSTFEPESDPGFSDGFDAALDLLRSLWTVFVVALGFVLPLLVFAPLVLAALWWWRRRRTRKASETAATIAAARHAPAAGDSVSTRTPPPPNAPGRTSRVDPATNDTPEEE